MMMDRVSICIFLWLPLGGFSQNAIPSQLLAQQALDRIRAGAVNSPGNVIYGLPAPPGETIGDSYLDRKWNNGSVMLNEPETLIEGYPLKYDLMSHLVEIKTKGGIKLLDTRRIKSLVWVDSVTGKPRYFVNAKDYHEDDAPLLGLMEVLSDGKKSLFCRTTVHVKSPDYLPALDVGSRDANIYKKSTFYFNQGNSLQKIKTRKNLMGAFGEKAAEVEGFIKANKLEVKNEQDLIRIFGFYNSGSQNP